MLIKFEKIGGLIQYDKHIPFPIRRSFIVKNSEKRIRGLHANKISNEVLICLNGKCEVTLDDTTKTNIYLLDSEDLGIIINNLTWIKIDTFNTECILLIYSDNDYDINERIDSYDELIKMRKKQKIVFSDLNDLHTPIKKLLINSFHDNLNKSNFIKQHDVFTSNFSKYIGLNYCVDVGNGTDALEIAIKSLDLSEDSEIIVQSNTFIATVLGITNNKLKPVFVDIKDDTLMLDETKIENLITNKTKAIIAVHLFGNACEIDVIQNICKKYNLYLIEDCAQAHGTKFRNQNVGTFGDISCFSFYPGKNLGCLGDGGAICTNNEILFNNIKLIRNLGSNIKYNHIINGRNSRLDYIQADFLNIKLNYIDEYNEKRHYFASIYSKFIIDYNLSSYIEPYTVYDHIKCTYHLYIIKVFNNHRDKLQNFLTNNNIETLIHYPIPIHLQKCYKDFNYIQLPITEKNSSQILSLPLHPNITIDDINYIMSKIKSFFTINNF